MTTLHIDSSANLTGSNSRKLGQYLAAKLDKPTVYRDLVSNPVSLPSAEDLMAFKDGTDNGNASLSNFVELSNTLINELKQADTLVIGASMYNFSVSSYLKLWIDAICVAGKTFHYTEQGPQGLCNIEKAYIITVTGGTPVGSSYDHCSSYIEQVCRFIGVKEIYHIDASGSKGSQAEVLSDGERQIDALLAK
ncbi:NAD(P)H-dependent oxidoreductase [uncultured Pseudoteredinibacter sp.]|uniref:FMN-dependent NADH-azoreductase n=1 Tax=uncultured Pseudoteredinibacter sp. TaxID=1641701 RepID=UPI00263809FC|nr:NAD(P)H-dependent oxidoreductase [uncultured Pseudoteredinibacter sp.]